jgi:hypothetical protein
MTLRQMRETEVEIAKGRVRHTARDWYDWTRLRGSWDSVVRTDKVTINGVEVTDLEMRELLVSLCAESRERLQSALAALVYHTKRLKETE